MPCVREVTKPHPDFPGDREKRVHTGRYEAMVCLGKDPGTGKTRWRTKTFGKKRDAEAWARKLEVQRDDGAYRPTVSKATLADYLRDTWLPLYRTQVRSTYSIETILAKWIFFTSKRGNPEVPSVGAKRMEQLTVTDFNKFYLAMARCSGVQYRSIEHLHGILRRALKHAVRTGQLPRNPTDFATLPKPNVKAEITCAADEDDEGEVKYLNEKRGAQVTRFRQAAERDRYAAFWLLLLDAGLRPGEAFALTWKHVDFARGVVKVRRTLKRLRGKEREARGRGWIVTKPKTPSSIRDVPVSKRTLAALEHWKAQQNTWRLHLGAEWQDHGFVFTTECGAPLGNNKARMWTRVLRAADGGRGDLGVWGEEPKKPKHGPTAERSFTPRFSMYVLRHTSATFLLQNGMDLLTVSRRLGHKNITITARFYAHITAQDSTAAAVVWDQFFGAAKAS